MDAMVRDYLGGERAPQLLEQYDELAITQARRTAFVARFIVLRESKRTRAHRLIEHMSWKPDTTAKDLAETFRKVFKDNGDSMMPVDRDIRRALAHSERPINQFIAQYSERSTISFVDALFDYERSNKLLFGEDEQPKHGGWRLPSELKRDFEAQKKK
jgi:hypothetical protein